MEESCFKGKNHGKRTGNDYESLLTDWPESFRILLMQFPAEGGIIVIQSSTHARCVFAEPAGAAGTAGV